VTRHSLANGNTAVGTSTLFNNFDGFSNTAVGQQALVNNTTGSDNTAIGSNAANFATGTLNTVVGALAGGTSNGIGAGIGNTVVGAQSGEHIGAGSFNLYLGSSVDPGVSETGFTRINDNAGQAAGSNSTVFFGGIGGSTVGAANTPVLINAFGQLGTMPSSARYKKDIESMGKSSEAIYSLRPVTFHYKGDETNLPCFGLIAEEVAKVDPTLILLDKEGKAQTVRYEQINAMLLNEFLKKHRAFIEEQRKVEKLEATVAQQHKDFEAALAELKGQIQKVSAQVEMSRPAPQTVLNNQ